MENKVFLLVPFIAGVGVMVLVVATAALLAFPLCDGFMLDYSKLETEKDACARQGGYVSNKCTNPGDLPGPCLRNKGVFGQEALGNSVHFFTALWVNNPNVGVVETPIRCASWWNCKNGSKGVCRRTNAVFENGERKYFYVSYYTYATCVPWGG
jgi:hypothetical protein